MRLATAALTAVAASASLLIIYDARPPRVPRHTKLVRRSN
jgi:hypothetical protein